MQARREYCSRGHSMDDPYVTKRRNGRMEYQCRTCKKAQARGEDLGSRDVHTELAATKAQLAVLEKELLDAYRMLARRESL